MTPETGKQGRQFRLLRGGVSSLGIPAKTVNRQKTKSVNQSLSAAAISRHSDRWRLLEAAQRLLNDKGPFIDRNGDERSRFLYRAASCQRGLHGIPPAIYGNRAGDRAELRDVQTCGSVWHCPVCAGKVTSGRRDELGAMLSGWAADGSVFLLTYTHSHGKYETPLAAQLASMQRAYKGLCNSKGYKKIMLAAGSAGAVRALEVTHGDVNGWHPHIHALLFVRRGAREQLARLRKLWVRQLVKAELTGIRPGMTGAQRRAQLRYLMMHALDIRDGTYAAEYVAKYGMEPATDNGGRWGLGSEVTQGHMKSAERLKGRTPFALLRLYSERGALWAGDYFREYALAFDGKRQLVASPGLRQRIIDAVSVSLNLDLLKKAAILAQLNREKTDDDLAGAADKRCDVRIARLTFAEWRSVLMWRAVPDMLDTALLGAPAVRDFLDDLAARPPPPFAEHFAQHGDDGAFLIPLKGYGRAA